MKMLLIMLVGVFCGLNCEEDTLISWKLTIRNDYISNSLDNYQDEIEVNFKLESNAWLWQYEGSERPKIPTGYERSWTFRLDRNKQGVYVHARFYYEEGVNIKFVQADTVLNLNENKVILFWNCGDSTQTEFPFPACFKGQG